LHNDLNVTVAYRACVVVTYVLAVCLLGAAWWPVLLAFVPPAIAALWLLDWPYYRFFASRRGAAFALAWFPMHVLHHFCNGLSFIVGTALYASRRWTGNSLPWALPMTPWPGNKALATDSKRIEHLASS
jgi:uncharacterized RDD family membrane protein YckC